MWNRISGGFGVVFGGALLIYWLTNGGARGGGSYASGQNAAMIMGWLLLVSGLYYLIKGDKAGKKEKQE